MGLFSKKPKKSFEECLEQRSAEALRTHAEKEMYVSSPLETFSIWHSCTELPFEDGTDPYTAPVFGSNIECYKLFAAAARKGDSLGAFYAAICYQHGIGVAANESTANEFYDMAVVLGGVGAELSGVISDLKKDMWFVRSYCEDQVETLAMDMFFMLTPSIPHHKYIENISQEAKDVFLKIATYLLYYYAVERKTAWARGLLGFVVIDYEKYPEDQFYRFKLPRSKERRQKMGVKMLEALVLDARSGNKYAHNFCQDKDLYNKLSYMLD